MYIINHLTGFAGGRILGSHKGHMRRIKVPLQHHPVIIQLDARDFHAHQMFLIFYLLFMLWILLCR